MIGLPVEPRFRPSLDPGFVPAELWTRAFDDRVSASGAAVPVAVAVVRPDGTVLRTDVEVLPDEADNVQLNRTFLERTVKLMLWSRGGSEIVIAGHDGLAAEMASIFSLQGERAFDCDLVGRRIFLDELRVRGCPFEECPREQVVAIPLGRNLDGCRIGFDLGGSDRKCAAVIDGEVVHSEEVEWNPYFEADPSYHYDGIMDSLRRAANHLPRVDAIGGSAAGVYVGNEPRAASLFRGVGEADFDEHVRPIFRRVRSAWRDVPLEVVNDGEVTALAASMSLGEGALLGISMGTSLAAGYCDADGMITSGLNELAFVPVDYREDAPVDEWSGDRGCGVQYFSQQAVARLAPAAGLDFPRHIAFPARLQRVQELMAAGDERARTIYETIGVYFGYSIAWYARWYDLRHLLILGRVTSGAGGEVILGTADKVLREEFPELAGSLSITTPDENFKRHGQAIAAASLPRVEV